MGYFSEDFSGFFSRGMGSFLVLFIAILFSKVVQY